MDSPLLAEERLVFVVMAAANSGYPWCMNAASRIGDVRTGVTLLNAGVPLLSKNDLLLKYFSSGRE